jgi:hypothetical protein
MVDCGWILMLIWSLLNNSSYSFKDWQFTDNWVSKCIEVEGTQLNICADVYNNFIIMLETTVTPYPLWLGHMFVW